MAKLVAAALLLSAVVADYSVSILSKGKVPAMSIMLPVGTGYSPCKFTFNPAWFPTSVGLNQTILFFRASGCPTSYGGGSDHILFAYCKDDGTCGDAQNLSFSGALAAGAEDPRVVFNPADGFYYMYIFGNGAGQATVYLYRTATPLVPSSWKSMLPAPLPWHRNGCVILRPNGTHYVIFGEAGPLPGVGIATTTDWVNYKILNATWLKPNGADDPNASEIVIEVGAPGREGAILRANRGVNTGRNYVAVSRSPPPFPPHVSRCC